MNQRKPGVSTSEFVLILAGLFACMLLGWAASQPAVAEAAAEEMGAATRELSEDLAKIAHELVADVTPVADVALEFKDEKGNSATLLDKPCENAAILKVGAEKYGIPDTYLDRMRAGKMLYEGKSYETCWVLGPDGTVYIVDSAGDMSGIPVDAFERPTGS